LLIFNRLSLLYNLNYFRYFITLYNNNYLFTILSSYIQQKKRNRNKNVINVILNQIIIIIMSSLSKQSFTNKFDCLTEVGAAAAEASKISIITETVTAQFDKTNDNSNQNDDWIAINANLFSTGENDKQEIINIVSISVEKESIIIVCREHNRLASDDDNTKQWFGIYTVQELYTIHEQMSNIDQSLNELYPQKLKPMKGLLGTVYFIESLKHLQDTNDNDDNNENKLCQDIANYLQRAFISLGKNMYADILFNDINSSEYFEVYSELNLKRLESEIECLKVKLDINNNTNTSTTKSSNLKDHHHISERSLNPIHSLNALLNIYTNEDVLVEKLVKIYAEYYNNMLKPLVDSRQITNGKLVKYENKLVNQMKTSKVYTGPLTLKAIEDLNQIVAELNSEQYLLDNHIDSICVQYKQSLIELFSKIVSNIKKDRQIFIERGVVAGVQGIDILFDEQVKTRNDG
jgi:hypothetical protein